MSRYYPKKVCTHHCNGGEKQGNCCFIFSLIPYPQNMHARGTPPIHRLYTAYTPKELGKITYSKIAHILYVFLYSATLSFSLSYRNSALGITKVVVCTMWVSSEWKGEKKGVTAAEGDDALGVRRYRLRWGVR